MGHQNYWWQRSSFTVFLQDNIIVTLKTKSQQKNRGRRRRRTSGNPHICLCKHIMTDPSNYSEMLYLNTSFRCHMGKIIKLCASPHQNPSNVAYLMAVEPKWKTKWRQSKTSPCVRPSLRGDFFRTALQDFFLRTGTLFIFESNGTCTWLVKWINTEGAVLWSISQDQRLLPHE